MTNSKKPGGPLETEGRETEVKKMSQQTITQVLLCASLVLGIVTAVQRWKNHW